MSSPAPDPDVGSLPTRQHGDAARAVGRLRHGVKLLATEGDRVLMVEETRTEGPNFWTIPGGGLRPSESPRAGLEREVAEELGGDVDVDRAVGRCAYRHTSRPDTVSVYTVYRGTVNGAIRPNPTEGVVDYAWTTPPVPEDTLWPFRRVIRQHADTERAYGDGGR